MVNGGLLVPAFPKTREFKFEDFVICDPKGDDFQFLVQLSAARIQFTTAMDGGSPASVLRLVSDYLPLLWRFVSSIKHGTGIRQKKPLEFEWTSAFQCNSKKKAKFFAIHSPEVELLMVLVCFAVAHLQLATEILSTTTTEREVADSGKEINAHFLGAWGIFNYILSDIMPFKVLSKERPIELLQPFHVCMAKSCAMMANAVVLRKSIEDKMKPLSQCRHGCSVSYNLQIISYAVALFLRACNHLMCSFRLALYSHHCCNEADAALRALGVDMDLIPLPLSLYIRCHKNFYLVRLPPPPPVILQPLFLFDLPPPPLLALPHSAFRCLPTASSAKPRGRPRSACPQHAFPRCIFVTFSADSARASAT